MVRDEVGGQFFGSKQLVAVERTGKLEMVRRVGGSPQQLVKSEGNCGGGSFPAEGAHQMSLQGVLSPVLQKLT
jgi:hypothetical protein